MAIIGYIRVSSNRQTCEHQHYEIEQFAQQNNIVVDKWVEETISSRKPLNKRKLGQLLNELQPNDILIAAEISRLGRSMMEVMRILETCLNKNCQVWTIKENYKLGNGIQSKVFASRFDYWLSRGDVGAAKSDFPSIWADFLLKKFAFYDTISTFSGRHLVVFFYCPQPRVFFI